MRISKILISSALVLLTATLTHAQTIHSLSDGTPEGMKVALSSSPVKFGCTGSVAVEIPDIHFENDSARLRPSAQNQMAILAQAMRDDDFTHDSFVIEGHASAPGSVAHNQRLSEQRAHAVTAAMHSLGVPSRAITTLAYGEQRLLYRNRPDHPHNRRVTVRRVGAGSAIADASRAAQNMTHDLIFRVMVTDKAGSYWADPKTEVLQRSVPIHLCLSASRAGILVVEIQEEGRGAFAHVGSWPTQEGQLIRVPEAGSFKFTGQPSWQNIRLRHVDCNIAVCPKLGQGNHESIEIDGPDTAPVAIPISPSTLSSCTAQGVICKNIHVRHE